MSNETRTVDDFAFPLRASPASDPSSSKLGLLLTEWLGASGADGLFRTCNNCSYMSGKHDKGEPAYCNLYKMVPPAHVIVTGCPSHKDEHETTHNPYEPPF